MEHIWISMRRSLESLLRLRVVLLLLLPPLISFVFWMVLLILFWGQIVSPVVRLLKIAFFYEFWIGAFPNFTEWQAVFEWFGVGFVFLFSLPIVYLSGVLLTSVFVVPYLSLMVSREDYPSLEKKAGGSLLGSLWNSLWAAIQFLLLLFLSLPLWLVPGMQVVIPLLLMAQLNRKVFLYDSLQEFASKEERDVIARDQKLSLFGLGVVVGLLNYLPFAFLLAPFLATLSYLHFCLGALERLRKGGKSE